MFSDTSRNLDVYLSAYNLRNFLQDACLQATIHRIRDRGLVQPSLKIPNDITSLGSYAHTDHASSKMPSDLRPNMRSSSHEYSSTWRLPENLIQRIEDPDSISCHAFIHSVDAYKCRFSKRDTLHHLHNLRKLVPAHQEHSFGLGMLAISPPGSPPVQKPAASVGSPACS